MPAALLVAGEDRRSAAARCLGELVRKMGERVLHRMLPILRDTMASPDAATRQGVCTGLKEVSRTRQGKWANKVVAGRSSLGTNPKSSEGQAENVI